MTNKKRQDATDHRKDASLSASTQELAIVGVGASAGGLGAFEELLRGAPHDPGFAIVFVQHLSPQHESSLPALLAPVTPLPVLQIVDGMTLEANRVYVVPANAQLRLVGRTLRLEPRPEDLSQYTPIDYFFRSLAEQLQGRAVGVILSGTGRDGALGMRDIKAAGGVTLVQSPETAEYDGMPRAAMAVEAVDLALPPEEIGDELSRVVRHPAFLHPERKDDEAASISKAQWQRLFVLLNQATGADFAGYKLPTIQRRLRRRMALTKAASLDAYLADLEQSPAEAKRLFQDMLIQVTRFFREPEGFKALARLVAEELLPGRGAGEPIRIWAPGCATGEDAYSTAIVLLETLRECGAHVPVQIFGTDLSEAAIDRARSGIYPPTIAEDVGERRLQRFFNRTDGSYRVNRQVRDTCIFARQDATRDPPYSRLDLILCRNLLIYLGAAVQKKLMHVFHYALRPNGFLILGHAETVGTSTDLFRVVDNKQRIYRKNPTDAALPPQVSAPHDAFGARRMPQASENPRANHAQAEANRLLLERYAPPGVIVDAKLQIIEFRGQTHPFLAPAPGAASFNLLKMVQEGLSQAVRSAVHEAQQNHVAVRKEGLHVRVDSQLLVTNLVVLPLYSGSGDERFLVLFEKAEPPQESQPAALEAADGSSEDGRRITRLEQELKANREYLQSVIRDLELANEELQSANEEILSSNEELQSTNEELDTAKEELQSTNEELNTVNEDLHGRNEELSRLNSDLVNLLASIQIAIVIVSGELRIRRFTPMAEKVLNLIPGDIGRPIGQIKPNINCPDLERLIDQVVDRVTIEQHNVQDVQGKWYSLTIRPYKSLDDRIDGAVLSLFEISPPPGS